MTLKKIHKKVREEITDKNNFLCMNNFQISKKSQVVKLCSVYYCKTYSINKIK